MPLSRERNTIQIGDGLIRELGVKTNTRIFAGALVVNDGGVAAPGRTAKGLVCLGRAEQTVDNTGGADNAVRIRVRRGVFGFRNQADDPILAVDIGKECYLVDDETVARQAANETRSVAGRVFSIDGETVFVDFT
jgi:hypothetical protein